MKTIREATAMRLRSRRRPARRQGLFPANSLALSPGARPTSGSGTKANSAVRFLLLLGCLVEHEVQLWAPREPFDARRHEIDEPRVELRHARHRVRGLLVDLGPCV